MDIAQLTKIAAEVIAPVIVMAGVGFLLGWRRVLEPEPIARIYMAVFAPSLAFVKLLGAELSGAQLGQILLFCFISVAILIVLARLVSGALHHDRGMRGAFANSLIMYNSANYGLPVQKLAFPGLGAEIQPIVLMTQNLVGFTLGSFNAASNSPSLLATARQVLMMPLTWGLAAGALCRLASITPGQLEADVPMLWRPISYFSDALVPVALLSLGVQLSRVKLRGKVLILLLGSALRLLVAPLVGLAVGWLLGLRGELLAVLVVSLSFPTAVFSAVLATEFKNHEDYAAAVVFVSTVMSIVTVTLVIYLTKVYLVAG